MVFPCKSAGRTPGLPPSSGWVWLQAGKPLQPQKGPRELVRCRMGLPHVGHGTVLSGLA